MPTGTLIDRSASSWMGSASLAERHNLLTRRDCSIDARVGQVGQLPSGGMTIEKITYHRDIALVLFDERHMAAVLEHRQLAVRHQPRDRLGPLHRARSVRTTGPHAHRRGPGAQPG